MPHPIWNLLIASLGAIGLSSCSGPGTMQLKGGITGVSAKHL
jgi:hypothetical protein